MSTLPLISVSGLAKRYGRKHVLRGIDLDVEAGQVTALLGPNGAGKTTLLRIVSGLSKADRGQVWLGGVSMHAVGHEVRRYVGLVSHLPLLYDNLTALENLRFFASMYDMHAPDSRIEYVLRAVDLWLRRHDYVRTYSRGMVQRLSIARAILHNPPVLLLDEPDTGLDQESAQMLHDLLRLLGSSNRAILLSTHNLPRALEWADSVALLVNGKITYRQPTRDLSMSELHRQYHSTVQ